MCAHMSYVVYPFCARDALARRNQFMPWLLLKHWIPANLPATNFSYPHVNKHEARNIRNLTQTLSQNIPSQPNQTSYHSSKAPRLRPRALPASPRSPVPVARPSSAFSSPPSSPPSCTSSTPLSPPPSNPATSSPPASSDPAAASCPSCPNPSRAANPPSSRWATTASSACSPAMLTSGR